MLPSLIITLREGVEASLIIGIVAAFLVREGRRDAMRNVWIGVGIAIAICVAVAITLEQIGEQLPQKQQEGLETIIGLIAVSAVTYMIIWMRRHARGLRKALEGNAASALANGTTIALVAMAFLAVLREGFETSVFLLAVFQDSTDTTAAGIGAVLGLVVAIAIGLAIYRGGVKLNLTRFFKLTGVVLVFVAAGLLATTMHTAHEAGWINSFQSEAVNLSWLVQPGTWTGALLTGMLGLQPKPTTIEATAYLLYAVPMLAFVAWPDRWRPGSGSRSKRSKRVAGTAMSALLLIGVLAGCGSSSDTPKGKIVDVSLTDAGCAPANLDLPAGPTTFEVTNNGTSKVSEFEILEGETILGEVENISDGLKKSFSLTLKNGDYVTYCPGGDTEKGKLVVTGGSANADPEETAAVNEYRTYLEENTAELTKKTAAFTAAVRAGNVEKAKETYAEARIPYEKIEPVAESFGNLDPVIDARAGDVPKAEWSGFHPIEQALWVKNTTNGMAPLAAKLDKDVARLQKKVETVKIEPAQVANGANELLGEVSQSKITGEEERYSHTDLYDFQANVDGAQAAFDSVKPLLDDEALEKEIETRFEEVNKSLEPYKDGDGWVSYTELTKPQVKVLSQKVDALAESLSQVPAKIVQQ